MTRRFIRVLAAVAAIVVAGLAVAALARDPAPAAAVVDTNHGLVRLAKGEVRRILNAADGATAGVSNDELVAQGRKLFDDTSLYEDGESCQTCHAAGAASAKLGTMMHDKDAPAPPPAPAFAAVPNDFVGPRDPPALWDLDQTPPYFWNGDVKTLREALVRPIMGHFREFVPGGREPAAGVLDCAPDGQGNRSQACIDRAATFVDAFEAYIKTLDPPSTAFDQGTMSSAALRGETIFQGKGGCIQCHGGPHFTDNLVHNTGVPQIRLPDGRTTTDLGGTQPPAPAACQGLTPAPGCAAKPPPNSAFVNTPQMRDLQFTAPFMHNGVFSTLEQVVGFYNGRFMASDPAPTNTVPPNPKSIVGPLNLTDEEMRDLVAYLESL